MSGLPPYRCYIPHCTIHTLLHMELSIFPLTHRSPGDTESTGLMSTTQKAQFLHQVIFKFPTLIGMNDGRYPKLANDQLEKRISKSQCRFVRQRTGLRPSGKTVHDHQHIAVTLRSRDRHVQKVHGHQIPSVTHLDMPHRSPAWERGLPGQTNWATGQIGAHIPSQPINLAQ